MNEKKLIKALEGCRNDKQALKAIAEAGYKIFEDKREESGYFNLYIEPLTRIYRNPRGEYILQHWQKIKLEYSGAPMFSSNPSYF